MTDTHPELDCDCVECAETTPAVPRMFDPANVSELDLESLARELAATLNPLIVAVHDLTKFGEWTVDKIVELEKNVDKAQQVMASAEQLLAGGAGGLLGGLLGKRAKTVQTVEVVED